MERELQGLKPAVVAVEHVGAEAPTPYFEIEFGGREFPARFGGVAVIGGEKPQGYETP